MEVSGVDASDVVDEFIAHRFCLVEGETHYERPDVKHFTNLVKGVVSRQSELDRSANDCLAVGWSLLRLDMTLRALLRAGIFELLACPEVPAKAVISEYVELARDFFDGAEPGLVNGILDTLARRLRPAEFEPGSGARDIVQDG